MTVGGFYLYFNRENVSSSKDLTEINGTINYIDKVLVYSKKIRKTESDSTYHIYLNEYPSKFQVSYMPYNRKEFHKITKYGDEIILDIASEDLEKIKIEDEKIRSFSLTVNGKVYLSKDSGLRGFGKGYFELGIILISIIINFFLIRNIIGLKIKII